VSTLELGFVIPDTVDELLEFWGMNERWECSLLHQPLVRRWAWEIHATQEFVPERLPTRIGERVLIARLAFDVTGEWKVSHGQLVGPDYPRTIFPVDDGRFTVYPGDRINLNVHMVGVR